MVIYGGGDGGDGVTTRMASMDSSGYPPFSRRPRRAPGLADAPSLFLGDDVLAVGYGLEHTAAVREVYKRWLRCGGGRAKKGGVLR